MAATIAVYMFVVGVTALFWGPFCDRWGRRKTLLISCTAFTLFSIGCVFSWHIDSEPQGRAGRRICASRRALPPRGPQRRAPSIRPAARAPPLPDRVPSHLRAGCANPSAPSPPPRSPHHFQGAAGRRRVCHDGRRQRGAGGLVGAGAAREGDGGVRHPHA